MKAKTKPKPRREKRLKTNTKKCTTKVQTGEQSNMETIVKSQ